MYKIRKNEMKPVNSNKPPNEIYNLENVCFLNEASQHPNVINFKLHFDI